MKRPTLQSIKSAMLLSLIIISPITLAAGLQSADAAATAFKTWLYGFLGITSVIYLLFKGLQVKANKATWGDFGMAVVWVAVLGGIPALAAWAWSTFA